MNGYSRYEDAMIAKLRLLEFTESHLGRRFLRGFERSMNDQHLPEHRMAPGILTALQVEALRKAEPIYVSMDMTDLVDHARESFQPETLLPSDPFTPHGFAVFPRALTLSDAPVTEESPWRSPQGLIPVRAIAWTGVHSEDLSVGCFWISHYSHVDDDEIYGRRHAEEEESRAMLRSIAPLSLVHTWQWTWGVDPRDSAAANLIPGEDPQVSLGRAHQQASFIQTFWRLGQQFVGVPHRVPRQIWRDAKRKGAHEHKDVTVMVLRRAKEVGELPEHLDESGNHYKVSFLVRGYWAVRHFRDGPRQVWVRPHVKGQGPLQVTERVWEFRR